VQGRARASGESYPVENASFVHFVRFFACFVHGPGIYTSLPPTTAGCSRAPLGPRVTIFGQNLGLQRGAENWRKRLLTGMSSGAYTPPSRKRGRPNGQNECGEQAVERPLFVDV
jgi:hypothetical protein